MLNSEMSGSEFKDGLEGQKFLMLTCSGEELEKRFRSSSWSIFITWSSLVVKETYDLKQRAKN